MGKRGNPAKPAAPRAGTMEKTDLPGYPLYPAGEDIFRKSKEAGEVNPEDPSVSKELNESGKGSRNNEKDFSEDMSGDDLDVPGSELDDSQEITGNEDEENNYYSLGGDGHSDLDED
jgi:hypothetical protein